MPTEKVMPILKVFGRLKERIDILNEQYDQKDKEISNLVLTIENMTKARWVLTEVQRLTQIRFKQRVESLVTMAIKSVFDKRNYGFELIFEEKRNQMEVRPVVFEIVNDIRYDYDDPEDDLGGGIIDVISMAMRIVLWSMEKPASRDIMIFDEPGKNLGDLIVLFGEILKEISHELGFQVIVITHDKEIVDVGDKVYHVSHNGKKSIVELR